MRLSDVLLWIEAHPGQSMVQGGKSATAKAASAATKTAATAQRAAANQARASSGGSGGGSSGSAYVPTGDPRIDNPALANQAQLKKYEESKIPSSLKPGGRYYQQPRYAYHVGIDENLQFSDSVKAQQVSESKSGGVKTTRTRTYDYGGQPISQRVEKQDSPSQNAFDFAKESQVSGTPNARGGQDLGVILNERLNFLADQTGSRGGEGPLQIQENYQTWDEGGEVTFSEKYIIPREERQKVKDFLSANPSKLYNIFDEKGKLVKSTSGRNVYPDILKFSLAGNYSIAPARGQAGDVSYMALGVGNIVAIPKGVYGPTKEGAIVQKQGPIKPPGSGKTPFQTLGSQFARPVKNLYITGKNIILGGEQATKPTAFDRLIEAGSATTVPLARSNIAPILPGVIRPPTEKEKAETQTAFPKFIKESEQQIRSDPQEFIVPLAGEAALWVVPPIGAARIVAKVLENKIIAKAVKDIRGIYGPKELETLTLREKIPVVKTYAPEDVFTTYHGTSIPNAQNILKSGFKTDEIWVAKNPRVAAAYSSLYDTRGPKPFVKIDKKATGMILEVDIYKPKGKILPTWGSAGTYTPKPEDIIAIRGGGKTYIPTGTSLGKNIAGKGLIQPEIKIEHIGGNVVRIESRGTKQTKVAFYDVKTKEFGALAQQAEGEVSKSYRSRGPLTDITQKQSRYGEQQYYGLTQVGKDIYTTSPKPKPTEKQLAYLKKKGLSLNPSGAKNIPKALQAKSDVLTQIGTFKIFTLKQAQKDKRLFGRYLFGEEAAPVTPKADIGLLETIGYRTGGTKVGKELPTKGYVKTTLDITQSKTKTGKDILKIERPAKFIQTKRDVFGNVYKPYKESKVSITGETKVRGPGNYITSKLTKETFFKRLPTSSFVTDVKKNIRFGDPFSKRGKPSDSDININRSMLGTTEASLGKYPTGKRPEPILTKTKAERDIVIEKLKKNEMDILFQKPRFKEEYGWAFGGSSILLAETSTERYPKDVYGNRMVDSPNENIFTGSELSKLNITPERGLRSKLTPGIVTDIIPKVSTGEKLKTNVFPIGKLNQSPLLTPSLISKTTLVTTPIITQITTPITTPVQIQKTTPITIQKTTPELIPKIPTTVPEKVIPLIIPPFIPIFGSRGGRDFDSPSPPQGENLDWRGNVPEDSIIGIYGRRSETTYTIGKVPGLKKKDRIRTAKPIKGFGNRNTLNISNKNNSFSGSGKSKPSVFGKTKSKKIRF